jgi:hypothetical protein
MKPGSQPSPELGHGAPSLLLMHDYHDRYKAILSRVLSAGFRSSSVRGAEDCSTPSDARAVQQRQHVALQTPLVPALVSPGVRLGGHCCRSGCLSQITSHYGCGSGSNCSLVVLISVPRSSRVQAIRSKTEVQAALGQNQY